MFLRVEETPNPETRKFIPDSGKVMEKGSLSVSRGDGESGSELANILIDTGYITNILFMPGFMSITKAGENEWDAIQPILLSAVIDYLLSGRPIIKEEAAKPKVSENAGSVDEVIKQIVEIIEERIKPAVNSDGGDVVFKKYEDKIVYLELRGACSACPSATITLKSGIENTLKHFIPEILEVKEI